MSAGRKRRKHIVIEQQSETEGEGPDENVKFLADDVICRTSGEARWPRLQPPSQGNQIA